MCWCAVKKLLTHSLTCAKNCQIWWKFVVVITKIILLVFLRHGVYVYNKTATVGANGHIPLYVPHDFRRSPKWLGYRCTLLNQIMLLKLWFGLFSGRPPGGHTKRWCLSVRHNAYPVPRQLERRADPDYFAPLSALLSAHPHMMPAIWATHFLVFLLFLYNTYANKMFLFAESIFYIRFRFNSVMIAACCECRFYHRRYKELFKFPISVPCCWYRYASKSYQLLFNAFSSTVCPDFELSLSTYFPVLVVSWWARVLFQGGGTIKSLGQLSLPSSGVGKSTYVVLALLAGVKVGCVAAYTQTVGRAVCVTVFGCHCQLTLCDDIWQKTPRSSEMGFPVKNVSWLQPFDAHYCHMGTSCARPG